MKSDVEKKLQPDNGLPQISVKPVKMFMQRSLTKQDRSSITNNRDSEE